MKLINCLIAIQFILIFSIKASFSQEKSDVLQVKYGQHKILNLFLRSDLVQPGNLSLIEMNSSLSSEDLKKIKDEIKNYFFVYKSLNVDNKRFLKELEDIENGFDIIKENANSYSSVLIKYEQLDSYKEKLKLYLKGMDENSFVNLFFNKLEVGDPVSFNDLRNRGIVMRENPVVSKIRKENGKIQEMELTFRLINLDRVSNPEIYATLVVKKRDFKFLNSPDIYKNSPVPKENKLFFKSSSENKNGIRSDHPFIVLDQLYQIKDDINKLKSDLFTDIERINKNNIEYKKAHSISKKECLKFTFDNRKNFVENRIQHYGTCWAHASADIMNEQLKLSSDNKVNNQFISLTSILKCHPKEYPENLNAGLMPTYALKYFIEEKNHVYMEDELKFKEQIKKFGGEEKFLNYLITIWNMREKQDLNCYLIENQRDELSDNFAKDIVSNIKRIGKNSLKTEDFINEMMFDKSKFSSPFDNRHLKVQSFVFSLAKNIVVDHDVSGRFKSTFLKDINKKEFIDFLTNIKSEQSRPSALLSICSSPFINEIEFNKTSSSEELIHNNRCGAHSIILNQIYWDENQKKCLGHLRNSYDDSSALPSGPYDLNLIFKYTYAGAFIRNLDKLK